MFNLICSPTNITYRKALSPHMHTYINVSSVRAHARTHTHTHKWSILYILFSMELHTMKSFQNNKHLSMYILCWLMVSMEFAYKPVLVSTCIYYKFDSLYQSPWNCIQTSLVVHMHMYKYKHTHKSGLPQNLIKDGVTGMTINYPVVRLYRSILYTWIK